jgi:hypothetical protein
VGVVAVILAATLWPDRAAVARLPIACLYCSQRASADAIANVILFLPLGLALAWARPTLRSAWRVGLALSLGIEFLQQFIVGRDPAIGDVLTNTLGTQVGWATFHHVRLEWRRAPRWSPSLLAGGAFATIVAAVLWLLGPAPTRAVYYGQWTPVLTALEWYRGRVLDARIDGTPLPRARIPDAPVAAFVARSGRLAVRAIAGPPVPALAPLFRVADEAQREILLLGAERDALVLRYRRRAAAIRLDEPDLRFEHALRGVSQGDTVTVVAERDARAACVSPGSARHCVPLVTPGRGWSLVYYPEGLPDWARRSLDMLWLGGLAVVVGWYAGMRRPALGGVALCAGVLTLGPLALGIAATPPTELLAAAAGWAVGAGMREMRRPRG